MRSSSPRSRLRRHGAAAASDEAVSSSRSRRSSATDVSRSDDEALLEHRVPGNRDPHEPDDHLAVVGGLAAAGALLREPDLGEQGTHGGNRPETIEPLAQAAEERDVGRAIARDVPEARDRPHVRIPVRGLEREVAHPAAVRRDGSVQAHRQDETAHRRRGEDRATHRLRPGRPRRVGELEVPQLVRLGVLADVGRENRELDRRGSKRFPQLFRASDPLGDRRRQRVVVEPSGHLPHRPRPEDLARLELEDERPRGRRGGRARPSCRTARPPRFRRSIRSGPRAGSRATGSGTRARGGRR